MCGQINLTSNIPQSEWPERLCIISCSVGAACCTGDQLLLHNDPSRVARHCVEMSIFRTDKASTVILSNKFHTEQ